MSVPITWQVFRGESPKHAPRLLPPGYAQQAYRCKLYDGKLKPWFKLKHIADLLKPGANQSIYPMRDGGTTHWLHWNEVVDVTPARVAGDSTQRVAYTGYGTPKATNLALATSGSPPPFDWWRLGVPAPITAPTAAAGAGGTGITRDRAYLVTFVHAWADGKTEESAPSPASNIVAAKSGQTVDLTSVPRWIITPSSITRSGSVATVTVPAGHVNWFGDKDRVTIAGADQAEYNGVKEITRLSDTQFTYEVTGAPATPATGTITVKSNHNITKKRIYRTVVGNAGAFFRFIAEVNESDTTYSDTSVDTTVALNEVIPSFDAITLKTWDMPPLDMHSIIDCGNGVLAGLSGNQLCFSEPFFYHAWPELYRRTLPFPGVGLGVVGNTVVVPTTGFPVTYSGTHPAAMAESELSKLNHACVSKRGIVSLGDAVRYPAKEGLIAIGPGGPRVESNTWYDLETWAEVFPSTMRSFQYADRYFGAFDAGGGLGGAIIIDRDNAVGGIQTDDRLFAGGHFDITTGSLFLIYQGQVHEWNGDASQREIINWKSGQVILPAPMNFGAARVEADFGVDAAEAAAINAARAAAIAANTALLGHQVNVDGALNSAVLNELELNGDTFQAVPDAAQVPNITFSLYIKDELKFSKSIVQSGSFKLPSGYRSDDVSVLIAGNGIVLRVQLAENLRSLRNQ